MSKNSDETDGQDGPDDGQGGHGSLDDGSDSRSALPADDLTESRPDDPSESGPGRSTESRSNGLGGHISAAPWPALHFDLYIPHPPAAVWRALTDPDLLGLWWAPGDVKPSVGHRFTLGLKDWGIQPCEVTAVVPQARLEYHFARGVLDTTIVWRIEPEAEGARLYLEHAGFDLDSPMGRQAFAGMGNGWPHVLNRIEHALDEVATAANG